MKVYLAGPISGTSYEECTTWRKRASERLKDAGFEPISPMRGKAFLERETDIEDSYEDVVGASRHAIFARDRFDCVRSEILLLNLLGARGVTIGSVMELAWAHLSHNFCVVVMEGDNPHRHAFVREAASALFEDLDGALDYVAATFGER